MVLEALPRTFSRALLVLRLVCSWGTIGGGEAETEGADMEDEDVAISALVPLP